MPLIIIIIIIMQKYKNRYQSIYVLPIKKPISILHVPNDE